MADTTGYGGYGAFQDLDLIMDRNLQRAFPASRAPAPTSSPLNSRAHADQAVDDPVAAKDDEVAGVCIRRIGRFISCFLYGNGQLVRSVVFLLTCCVFSVFGRFVVNSL